MKSNNATSMSTTYYYDDRTIVGHDENGFDMSVRRNKSASSDISATLKHPYELPKEIRILQHKVVVLTVLFIVLCVACIGSTVIFICLSPRREQHFASFAAQSAAQGYNGQSASLHHQFCVNKEDSSPFAQAWEEMEYSKSKDEVCFADLSWVARIATLIYTSLEKRVDYLDEKIQNMPVNVSGLGLGKRGLNFTQLYRMAYNNRVFAHLFLNVTYKYSDPKGIGPLVWTKSGIDGSHARGMDVDNVNGELKVRQSGYYFIYSQVVFDMQSMVSNDTHAVRPAHIVFKNFRHRHSGGQTKLLEASADAAGPASLLQGVFLLHENDTIVTCAPTALLNFDTSRFTYLGAYLM